MTGCGAVRFGWCCVVWGLLLCYRHCFGYTDFQLPQNISSQSPSPFPCSKIFFLNRPHSFSVLSSRTLPKLSRHESFTHSDTRFTHTQTHKHTHRHAHYPWLIPTVTLIHPYSLTFNPFPPPIHHHHHPNTQTPYLHPPSLPCGRRLNCTDDGSCERPYRRRAGS